MKIHPKIFYATVALLLLAVPGKGQQIMLHDGDIYRAEEGNERRIRITYTDGKVKDLFVSPGNKYIAYLRIVRYVDSPGEWEGQDKIPMDPVCNVIIYDIIKRETIAEITPQNKNDIFLSVYGWTSEKDLLLSDGDGLAANATYIYDTSERKIREIEWEEFENRRNEIKSTVKKK